MEEWLLIYFWDSKPAWMTHLNEKEKRPIYIYFLSCFLLTLPLIVWNILLTDRLPSGFQLAFFNKEIPDFLLYGENISRTLIFSFTLFMPLHISNQRQKRGFWLYIAGMLLYFASWLMLIYFPGGSWSSSILGFMAPAYTPALWLTGIALMGNSFYFGWTYKPWMLILISVIFLIFHTYHTYIVFCRMEFLS